MVLSLRRGTTTPADDDGCPLDEFQLGRVFDDDGIAAEDAETFAVEAGAERDDELHGKIGTGGGNDAEDVFRTVLERAERGVDQRAAGVTVIQAVPREIDLWALLGIDERAGVVEERMAIAHGNVKLKRGGHLGDLSQCG